MRKIITVILAAAVTVSCIGMAYAADGGDIIFFDQGVIYGQEDNEQEYETEQVSVPTTNYMQEMITAAVNGDYAWGEAAQKLRDKKIDDYGLDAVKVAFEDLYLLAKIIYAEAGSEWLSDEWKMCVGEVVLNRVASPEFPDTISGVVTQPGQYYGAGSSYFANLRPNERCVRLALRLLEGERLMDSAVVFQANFRQGSGTHTVLYDRYLGSTYFCYSNKMSLYAG